MVTKTKKSGSKSGTRKVAKKKTTKTTAKKAPSNTALLKKVAVVSDSNKTLSKEIKSMTKIFADNQKILISIKNMIDAVSSTLEQIQKQSRQINIIEEDTQKLFSGLNQVRGQSKLVTKINDQTNRLQDKIAKIVESQKSHPETEKLMQKVSESIDSIRNNSKMIMKISEKAGTSLMGTEIGVIRKKIESISGKAEQIESLRGVIVNLKQDLESVVSKVSSSSGITDQIDEIKRNIQSISSRTGNLGGDITSLKDELGSIASKTQEKISGLSEILNRSDVASSEFNKKTNQIIQELQGIKNVTNKASEGTSKEVLALLKLSEFQSNIRMQSESKYGTLDELEQMATQTSEMVNLFDKLAIETNKKIALPHEVRRWAVSKIMDCADRWEIRFSDVYKLLANQLGNELLKEAIRLQQVRDIFGIRAVEEIRQELNIS